MKTLVAQEIAKRVKNGDVIGVGTGTTVDAALEAIGKRVSAEGLLISVVPTSLQTAWRCQELGLAVLHSGYNAFLTWGFDGADQVTKDRWAIKGKGGALLQEKLLAKRCKKFVIIVDRTKLVEQLGAGCPVPVEVLPDGLVLAEAGLRALGAVEITLRTGSGKHGPVITERGNILLDVTFQKITPALEAEIKTITGVVESGLFTGYVSEVLVGDDVTVTSL
ncbi:MAG: ribose 5-phosphate isomerase A [Pseudomonadota bacterium]|jgi:ribose 5-phosphate isomerase A